MTTLVLAYGSNLDEAERARVGLVEPHCRMHSRVWVPDHQLSFGFWSRSRQSAALDLRPCLGAAVPAVVLEVSDAGLVVLDRKEGVATGAYEQVTTPVVWPGGAVGHVLAYRATPARQVAPRRPDDAYLHTVRRGYAQHGFDAAPLQEAATQGQSTWGPRSVFVYGTLMRGERRAQALADPPPLRVEDAQATGTLWETDDDYPAWRLPEPPADAVVPDPAAPALHGERVDWAHAAPPLARLDEVEVFHGYDRSDNLFWRTLIEPVDASGRRVLAWAYAAGPEVRCLRPIPSGSWREHSTMQRT